MAEPSGEPSELVLHLRQRLVAHLVNHSIDASSSRLVVELEFLRVLLQEVFFVGFELLQVGV